MTLKSLLIAALLTFTTGASAAETWTYPYWSLQDYYLQFPKQKALSAALDARVQHAAVPVKTLPEKPVSIMVVQPGKQTSDYWKSNIRVISERLKEMGMPFRLVVFDMRPDEEARKQESKIAQALRQHPDYIITTLDMLPSKRILDRILADSHTKLILQNVTTPLKDWQDPHPLFYVGFDHQEGTRLLAQYYVKRLPFKSEFSVINWLPGYVSQARGDTFINEVEQQGGWQLESAFYSKGNRNSAYDIATHILGDKPHPRVIFCAATDVAVGAAEAVAKLAPDEKIWLNGWGGGDIELQMLKKREIMATVMRMNDDSGIAIAEVIAAHSQGKATPQVYSGKMTLITTETSSTEIQSLQQQAFRYSDHSF
ncbi:substrate-binding domain-containing protein [Pokkaliibacter sp. CJK22405]|uniref:substrate-binding domain-containing protein n=1 Tax=Pokkaliibacter sp. CJK22405 TaxID=3384615 RepID=UPI00398527ED